MWDFIKWIKIRKEWFKFLTFRSFALFGSPENIRVSSKVLGHCLKQKSKWKQLKNYGSDCIDTEGIKKLNRLLFAPFKDKQTVLITSTHELRVHWRDDLQIHIASNVVSCDQNCCCIQINAILLSKISKDLYYFWSNICLKEKLTL